jgi:cyclohexa-1,5-dienecarbonyl-CoA hydratase
MSELLTVELLEDGAIRRLVFGNTPGNILDHATLRALTEDLMEARKNESLKGIILEGAGEHFSYGASVVEHLPDDVQPMLAAVRQLVLTILDMHVVTIAVVRGRCLGGGLELASVCHRIVASKDATFAQPEIALGAFAPVASVVLPGRIGRGAAEDLCITGRTVEAKEAQAMGLIDEVAPGDPLDAAMAWARARLLPRSARSLRYAVQAVRLSLTTTVQRDLPELERLYLDGLMKTEDAIEGVRAFLEKRAPVWTNE